MPNQLPIPEELQHLIEKRAGEERRRQNDCAADSVDSTSDPEPEATPTRRVRQRRKR